MKMSACLLLAVSVAACSSSGTRNDPTSQGFNPKCEARIAFSGYKFEVKGISYPFGPPDATRTFTLAEASFGAVQVQRAQAFVQGIDLLGFHYCQMMRRTPTGTADYSQLLRDYTETNRALILTAAELEAASNPQQATEAVDKAKERLEELGKSPAAGEKTPAAGEKK